MADINTALGYVLNTGTPPPAPALQGPQIALVISADNTGVRVKIPAYHSDWAFGPCTYSWPGSGYPPAGTQCLVEFVGTDLSNPWVVAWSNAPGAAPSTAGQPLGLTGTTAATRYVGGTTTGAPTSGTFAAGDFAIAENGVVWICTTGGSPGTWTASYASAVGQPLSLTGTTSATRYVGATASGAPTSGTFAKGDYAIAQDGQIWVCTTAGTPGTWTSSGTASATAVKGLPLGLTGATSATRYVGGTTGGAPTSGTFAVGDFAVDQTGAVWVCTAAGTPGTWMSSSTGAKGLPVGLTGATAATRYVGATTSGAPTSGTFAKGDFVIDQAAKVWICTTAGTPGTWTDAAAASVAASKGLPLALTGATAATRYVGATTGGAPTSGTFAVGDFVIAQNSTVWVCTGAGSPGTWEGPPGNGSTRSGWTQTGVTLGGGTDTPISGLTATSGMTASPATFPGDGTVHLNSAGLWSLTLMCYSDNGAPHWSRIYMHWPNGAWAPAFTDLLDQRVAPAGFASGGTLYQTLHWSGYVSPAMAAAPITLYVAMAASDGSLSSASYYFVAEYHGGS